MTQIKKLTLDYSKWRSGGDSDEYNKVGEGVASLLNDEGFQCCIGQWCEQLGAPRDMLSGRGEPSELPIVYSPFNYCDSADYPTSTWNTKLSNECIKINDDPTTTPDEKIEKLTAILADYDIELEVINIP